MKFHLQQRRYFGASIGYFKWETVETFEDSGLALKEASLLEKRWGFSTRVLEVEE